MKKIFLTSAIFCTLLIIVFINQVKNDGANAHNTNTIEPGVEKNLQFCKKDYTYNQVLINGTDVVLRIAELSNKNIILKDYPWYPGTGHICDYLTEKHRGNRRLNISYGSTVIEGGQKVYTLDIDDLEFIINKDTYYIFEKVASTELNDPGNFGALVPIGQYK